MTYNSGSRTKVLHPNWEALISWCEAHPFAILERVNIQNGVPVDAKEAYGTVKFGKDKP